MPSHITAYSVMPIPPVEANTRWFSAGPLRIGVQYRVLDDAIAAAATAQLEAATGAERGQTTGLDDRGVALHVCAEQDGEWREHLRFDCFQEDPHYHYVSHRERRNEVLHLDPIADGDPLAWALERLRTRLPQMLARAGAADVVARLDARALEEALPRIAEAAYRARYGSDAEVVRAAALGASLREEAP
jgi:hypothetical protein